MGTFLGVLIPFLVTTFGAALVFFMKNKISNKVERFLTSLASGVMMAASI